MKKNEVTFIQEIDTSFFTTKSEKKIKELLVLKVLTLSQTSPGFYVSAV